MPKPKILFLITQSEFGGAQRFLFNLTTHLREEYDIAVAVGADGGGEFCRALEAEGIRTIAVPHLHRAVRPFDDHAAIGEIAQTIEAFAPDIVFISSSKSGVLGTMAAKRVRETGRKFTLIYRIDWAFNDPRPAVERALYAAVERALSPHRDIIVQNDRYDLRTARERGIAPRVGFTVIHNGVNPDAFTFLSRADARAFFRQKCRVDLDAFDLVLGNTANLYATKGLSYLIEAVADVAKDVNVAAVVAGEGPERPKLEALIKERGLERRIILAGQLPKASQYLNAYDVFAFSSLKEGFPWAILEAMSAERPIVATTVGAIPEVIEDGVSGLLVPPGDAKAMAEKIRWFAAHREAWVPMGAAARERVKAKFTLDRLLANYRALFSAVLEDRLDKMAWD
jgi:glycosyltransferase involved in cell wall biosynthesis